ncbi:MAG: methylated-DNA--[protein]-cysteine S-methyltransferase, partial [Actinomycetota bacterium]
MQLHTTTVPTPVGPFTLLVGGDGVCAAGFTGRPETLQRRLDPRRRAATVRPVTDPDGVASRLLAY